MTPAATIAHFKTHAVDDLPFGRAASRPCPTRPTPDFATIADMRRIGVSAFVIECAALYCYHQARIEFDALALPDELYAIDVSAISLMFLPAWAACLASIL
jgi:hypothetical protein